MTASPRPPGWVAFRHRDFALYCAGRFVSAMAVQVQTIAIGWLVYDITRDPLALGLVGLMAFLPLIGLALVTGHVADRFDRRAVLLVCYAIGVIAAAGLFACAWSGSRQVWPIYALMLLFGATRAFANPAGQALVPNLVPPEHFGKLSPGTRRPGRRRRSPVRRWAACSTQSPAARRLRWQRAASRSPSY
jgi:MFS family permease